MTSEATDPYVTHHLDELDLVGLREIAERLGVAPATVNHWRWRAGRSEGSTTYRTAGGEEREALPMPEPAITLSGTPIWVWAQIEDWAHRTGRRR